MDPVTALRTNFIDADYTVDSVMGRLSPAAQHGLARNSTVPAHQELNGEHDAQATLLRLFILQSSVAESEAAQALNLDAAQQLGLISRGTDGVRATVQVRPYAFETANDQWDGWLVSDHTPGLDHHVTPANPDHVLGVSPASSTLALMTIPDQVESALDLGTGCGVQSMHLASHSGRIVATDVKPRALGLAQLGARLNQIDVDFREGSLFEPVAGDKFDLIVTNPPYVMSPPESGTRLTYRETTAVGDDLVSAIVTNCADHLTEGGTCQVLANWAILDDDWQSRLASWAPAGADLHILERERLDPYEYIEMWLADAGLQGTQQWRPSYQQWLEYFERLGVTGIGMGWITVVNAKTSDPHIRIETWPYDVAQPVGPALGQFADAARWSRLSDEEMWQSCWTLTPDVRQETFGMPGASDPSEVVYRQHAGLKRARSVDTALGGVLGACDGTMPLRTIWDAVAMILELPATDHADSILAEVRRCVADGYLIREPG